MDQVHPPRPAQQPAKAPTRQPEAIAPSRKPPPKPKQADPAVLADLDEDGVEKMLGPPAVVQFRGTAKIAVWRSEICAFDVLMFQDVKSGTWRTLSWQMEDGAGTRSVAICFGSIEGNRP